MSDSSRKSLAAGTQPAAIGWHPLQRVAEQARSPVHFTLNGVPSTALAGDTLMTAILTQSGHLRTNEFSHQHRAGFCMMGACQDCLVELGSGLRVRACSTMVSEGVVVWTLPRPQAGDLV